MTPARLLSLGLALLLLSVGCIGTTEDLAENQLDPNQPIDRTPVATNEVTWDLASGQTTHTLLQEGPADGAAFLHWEGELGPESSLTLTVTTPSGEPHVLVDRSTSITGGAEVQGWAILDNAPGDWVLEPDGQGQSTGTLTFTLQPEAPAPTPVAGNGQARTVVAVVDTGINPYHDIFQRPELTTDRLPATIQETATGNPPISLPTAQADSYLESLQGDASLWTKTPSQQLVHFQGTNVLGYRLDDVDLPQVPVLDRAGHGTMVAHSVTRENPDVLVVMVTGQDYDEGVHWAAEQPWIDLISLSWGPAVNAAGAAEPTVAGFVTPEATRQAHEAGQLVFSASGNDPTLTFTDTTSGPPWVHAVAGAQPATQARAAMSGNLVDTVANWTQDLARHDATNETRTASGTSFATPTTAGIASRILHQVRASGAEVAPPALRDALNRTAVYWETTDYGGPGDPGPSIPVAPTPWVSMGWGYLDGRAVQPAVAGLLGTAELPTKSPEAQAYMAAHQDLREAWWQATG